MQSLGVSTGTRTRKIAPNHFYPKSALGDGTRGRRTRSSARAENVADPPPPKRKTKFGDPNNPAAIGGEMPPPPTPAPAQVPRDVLSSAPSTVATTPTPTPTPKTPTLARKTVSYTHLTLPTKA